MRWTAATIDPETPIPVVELRQWVLSTFDKPVVVEAYLWSLERPAGHHRLKAVDSAGD